MTAPADFRTFVEDEYAPIVRAVELVLGGEHAVAEELAQEAFLRASSRWERVGSLESPGGWVAHVALNLARSQLRTSRAARRAQRRLASEPPVVVDHDEQLSVHRALATLPREQRELVVLRYLLGFSSSEVARLTGLRPDNVRKICSRALGVLRAELGLELDEEVNHA